MNRRTFLKQMGWLSAGIGLSPLGCLTGIKNVQKRKVIVLGIDGMDIHITRQYMKKGYLPNFSKLLRNGSMTQVATSNPPQSPVAWSDFAVGASAEVHGIYDFIHRDPETMLPYLSTSKVNAPEKIISIGDYKIPVDSGRTENLRKGVPFWDYLAQRQIPTTISRMPANFPCFSEKAQMLSGMGTPDLRGGYGSFTYFTTEPEKAPKNVTGGVIEEIEFHDNVAKVSLKGPENTLKKEGKAVEAPFTIWRDRVNHVVRILIQGKEFILKQGEWTPWTEVSFPMVANISDVKGICRFYVQQIHPEFSMYVSPINIDPADPVLPIFSSQSYGNNLVKHVGRFYTQGLPDDTKALSYGILKEDEYLALARYVLEEQEKMLDFELDRFVDSQRGLLFFYISSIDQNTHMYWRAVDKAHPLYSEKLNHSHGDVLKKIYAQVDRLLGKVMDQFDIKKPENTLLVMSDHGFAPFRRQVNLNSWLHENGYLSLSSIDGLESEGFFEYVDWSSTAAYNIGINSIYLNLQGRERHGVLPKEQAPAIVEALKTDMLEMIDPQTGEKAVSDVWITPENHHQIHPHAPDVIVGWKRGYRCSWESILGGFSPDIMKDNDDKWSGDHCIDPKWVPAIFFCNHKISHDYPTLHDITASIISDFSIPIPEQMMGRPIYHVPRKV